MSLPDPKGAAGYPGGAFACGTAVRAVWGSAAPMMAASMVLLGSGLAIAGASIGLDTNKGATLLAAAMLIIALAMTLEYVG